MRKKQLIKSNLKSNNFGFKLSKQQLHTIIVLGILLLAICLRFIGLNKGLWLDEYYSIRWLSKGDFWQTTEALRNYNKPPLYFLLLYLWSQINHSEPFLRSLSILFDLGTVIVVIKWLKPYSFLASILAGLYFATTPIMLRYAQEIRPYSLLVFATVLSFFFASRIISNPNKKINYVGLGFGLSLAVASHLVGVMLILSIGFLVVAISLSDHYKIRWHYFTLSLFIPCLVFSYFYFFFLQGLNSNPDGWWMPNVSWYLISTTSRYVLSLSQLTFGFWENHLNFIAFMILIISISVFARNQNKLNWLLLIAAFIFWLQIILYSLVKAPIFWYRIILPGIIPFLAFVVLQIAAIKKNKLRLIYTVGMISCCLVFTFNWITTQAKQPVEEYREITNIIESQWQPNDLVIICPGFISSTVNYYLDGVSPQERLAFHDPSNYDKFYSAIAKKSASSPQNVFAVVRDLDIDTYQHLLSAIATQIPKPFTIHLLSIINHDTYFLKRSDTQQEILSITQKELGKPDSYQQQKLYAIAKWNLVK